jgi:stearoyl-CoA desaturase (Delta-9 desaturase)
MNPTTEINQSSINFPRAGSKQKLILQRRVALASVGIPTIGTAVAIVIALKQGVGAIEIALFLSMYVLTTIGVEVGMHRFFSHHAFRAGPVVTAFLALSGSMAAQGPVLFWAAVHRKHHAFTDREGDPHSPLMAGRGLRGGLRGFWHAHVGWLFAPIDDDWNRYVPDLFKDRWIFKLSQYYPIWVIVGLVFPTAVAWIIAGTWQQAALGFLWGGLVRIFAVDHVTWSVNSVAHMIGRRPYPTRCNAGNIALLSLPSIGGSWHNNHHARPSVARNDWRFWQIDPAGWFIELLAACGLAWNVRRASDRQLTS